MFKLVYLENANKDPIVRKLQGPSFKFVEVLEKIQQNNKMLFGGLKAVSTLIDSLSDRDFEVMKIKQLHKTNWGITEELFKKYYLMAIDLVNVLSGEIDSMTELGRLRKILEKRYGLETKSNLLLKQKIYSDKTYQGTVKKLLMFQHKFKTLNNQRIKVINELLSQLNSLMALERNLIEAAQRDTSLDQYDMTINAAHMERVVDNIKEYLRIFEHSIGELNKNHRNLEGLKSQISDIEREYRKLNSVDPNFHVAYNAVGSFEDMYHLANKVSRALGIEIKNLQQEVNMLSAKEKNLGRKDNLILMHHPKILGLASDQKTLKHMLKEHVKDTGTLVTELTDCISKADEDMDFCVSHLAAVKNADIKKMNSHIDYIKAQQQAATDKLKYSKLLMLLYKALNNVVRSAEMKELDNQSLEQQKGIASAIVKQMSAAKELEKHSRSLNALREFYARSQVGTQKAAEKNLKKNMHALIDIQNETVGIADSLAKQHQQFAKENVQRALVARSTGLDRQGMRDEIRDQLKVGKLVREGDEMIDRKMYPADWEGFDPDDPEPHRVGSMKQRQRVSSVASYASGQSDIISGSTQSGGAAQKQVTLGMLAKAIRSELGEKANAVGGSKLDKELTKALASVRDSVKKAKGSKKTKGQRGGAGLAYMITQRYTLQEFMKVLDQELAQARALAYQRTSDPMERIKIELVLNTKREDMIKSQITKMGGPMGDADSYWEKLDGQIAKEYILNAFFSNIGAYQKLYKVVHEAARSFETQNSLIRNIFAKTIRKVGTNSQDAADLRQANNEFGDAVKTLLMQVNKVDNLCAYKKIDVVEILKNPDENSDASKNAQKCSKAIQYVSGLSLDLVERTNALLQRMDFIHERVSLKEVQEQLGKFNLRTSQSQLVLAEKARNLALSLILEMRAFITEYMRMAYAVSKYTANNQLSGREKLRLDDIKEDLAVIARRLGTGAPSDGGSNLRTELAEAFEQLTQHNNGISELLKPGAKADSNTIVKLNILVQQRQQALNHVVSLLNEVEDKLAKQRGLLEEVSSIDIKHNMAMMQWLNKMAIVVYATTYDIKDKLVVLGAVRDAMNQQVPQSSAPGTYRELTTWVNRVTSNLLNVWFQIKNQLEEVLPSGQVKTVGGADLSSKANSMMGQATTVINNYIDGLKTRIDDHLSKVKSIDQGILQSTTSGVIMEELARFQKELEDKDTSKIPAGNLEEAGKLSLKYLQNEILDDNALPKDVYQFLDQLANLSRGNDVEKIKVTRKHVIKALTLDALHAMLEGGRQMALYACVLETMARAEHTKCEDPTNEKCSKMNNAANELKRCQQTIASQVLNSLNTSLKEIFGSQYSEDKNIEVAKAAIDKLYTELSQSKKKIDEIYAEMSSSVTAFVITGTSINKDPTEVLDEIRTLVHSGFGNLATEDISNTGTFGIKATEEAQKLDKCIDDLGAIAKSMGNMLKTVGEGIYKQPGCQVQVRGGLFGGLQIQTAKGQWDRLSDILSKLNANINKMTKIDRNIRDKLIILTRDIDGFQMGSGYNSVLALCQAVNALNMYCHAGIQQNIRSGAKQVEATKKAVESKPAQAPTSLGHFGLQPTKTPSGLAAEMADAPTAGQKSALEAAQKAAAKKMTGGGGRRKRH